MSEKMFFEWNGKSQSDATFGVAKKKMRKRKPAKKIENKWNVADETKLIAEIEQYSCLYDAGCEDNKDKLQREAAWRSVANAFIENNYSASECQAKWNSLRGTHRRLLKSQRQFGAATSVPKCNWTHFSSMSFIVEASKKIEKQLDGNLEVCTDPIDVPDNIEHVGHEAISSISFESVNSPTSSVDDIRQLTSSRPDYSHETKTGNNEQHFMQQLSAGLNEGLRYLTSAHNSKMEETEFDVFGKFVASELKSMELVAARQLKSKLTMYLANGTMEHMRSQSQYPTIETDDSHCITKEEQLDD